MDIVPAPSGIVSTTHVAPKGEVKVLEFTELTGLEVLEAISAFLGNDSVRNEFIDGHHVRVNSFIAGPEKWLISHNQSASSFAEYERDRSLTMGTRHYCVTSDGELRDTRNLVGVGEDLEEGLKDALLLLRKCETNEAPQVEALSSDLAAFSLR